jgi:hypothetical protein
LGSVDLTPGTRWVIYYPEETLGNRNPFEEDEDPEIDEHDTTPVVVLDEYVVDGGNADNDDDSDVDQNEQSFEEPEQEREAEDISEELSISGLSKSIQQSEREARRQPRPFLMRT